MSTTQKKLSMQTESPQDAVSNQLTPNRAFVVQFTSHTNFHQQSMRGRVEHVASGAAIHFDSSQELLEFIVDVLGTET
ncbi:MAG: hypothetical protein ACR2PS_03610 [Pseudomonadales bacterium]